ncbi:MAG TPA: hypothetical protein VEG39_02490 [Clostridia bacterium]|nr:hypothetical protein [Clostridia bacterium]
MVRKYMVVLFVILVVIFAAGYAEDDLGLKLDKEVYTGLNDQMKITLTAPSLNKSVRMSETALAKIAAADSSFSINVVLAETGKDTGIFTGSVYFSFSGNNAAEKKIAVKNDVKLRVHCEGLIAEAIWIPYNATLKLDADKYRGLGDLPKITLVDHDLDVKPNAVEEVQVLVKSSSYSKAIPVTLKETKAASGEFTGFVKLTTGPSDPKEGSLHIKYNDEITVTYNDSTNLNSSGKLLTASAIWTPQTAVVKLSKSSFSGLNSKCVITITDNDMNKKTDIKDIIDAKVTADDDPKGLFVRLTETKADSGIFSADVFFDRYSSNSARNTLKVAAKSDIKVTYCDEWNEADKRYVDVEANAEFQFVEAVLSASVDEGTDVNDSITITVKDPDADTNKQKNSVPVVVTSTTSENGLRLWLTETGDSTGSFKGILYFSTKPVKDKEKKDITLIVSQGDDIEVTYDDTTMPEGRPLAISRTYNWSYQKAGIKLDKESYIGYNSSAGITIKDVEANKDPDSKDRIKINVSSDSMSEFSLFIEETKADSGEFKGSVLFGRHGSKAGDILEVAAGDAFRVAYEDQGEYSFGTVEASAEWDPHDAEVTLNSDRYYEKDAKVVITVEDWDMADDADKKDSVTVSVGIVGKPAMIRFPLEETGKNTGIFKDTLIINSTNNKGLDFRLENGEELEVTYQDRDNTDNVVVERKASAMWFLKK